MILTQVFHSYFLAYLIQCHFKAAIFRTLCYQSWAGGRIIVVGMHFNFDLHYYWDVSLCSYYSFHHDLSFYPKKVVEAKSVSWRCTLQNQLWLLLVVVILFVLLHVYILTIGIQLYAYNPDNAYYFYPVLLCTAVSLLLAEIWYNTMWICGQ